jgi:integrase
MARRARGEGSIYVKRPGLWCGQVSTPDGERKTYYGHTQAEVRKKVREAVEKRDAGLPLMGRAPTVERWFNDWLASLDVTTDSGQQGAIRPLTYRSYSSKTKHHIVPALGKTRLDQLTRPQVQAFINDMLKAGLAVRTVAQIRAILRHALNLAVSDGVIARNPVRDTRLRQADYVEVGPLDVEQSRHLLEVAMRLDKKRRTAWGPILTLALSTGMRPGEVLGLQWGDLDPEGRTRHVVRAVQRYEGALHLVPPKTFKSRRQLPLPVLAVSALKVHQARQREAGLSSLPSAWVFPSRAGTLTEPRNVVRAFKRLLVEAGLPTTTRLYDLRHGFASLLLAAGEHPKVVADLLGHSTTRLTLDTYTHVLPELTRQAADHLDAILSREQIE